MKELLERLRKKEAELAVYQEAIDYWTELPEPDYEMAEHYEGLSDSVYEEVYALCQQAADRIVSITAGQIDKITAMKMMRLKRNEIERMFG